MSDHHLQLVTDTLIKATKQIKDIYFQLPVAGLERPIFRERVYCYELYHQMRKSWPEVPHKITGEIDKSGHPWIYPGELNRSKPDFTIHVPPGMSDNLLVIEVKPPRPSKKQIVTDLRKLTAYCRSAGYSAAYYLVYGRSIESAVEFASRCESWSNQDDKIDLSCITLFTHPCAGAPAVSISWPNRRKN